MFGKVKLVAQQSIKNTYVSPLIIIETPYHKYLVSGPHDTGHQLTTGVFGNTASRRNTWEHATVYEFDKSDQWLTYVYWNAKQEYWILDSEEMFDKLCLFFMRKSKNMGSKNPYSLIHIW